MARCGNCNGEHSDLDKADGEWCFPCIDAEMIRSRDEDSVGEVRTVLGQPMRGRSRPPKFMLRPEEYEEHGY